MNVAKFTLNSGKVIYLREPRIGDTEKAAQVAGKKASSQNEIHTGLVIQSEMLKILLVQIDEKKLGLIDKEQLDKLFTFKEHRQALKAVQKMLEDDEEGNEQLIPEFSTFGDK